MTVLPDFFDDDRAALGWEAVTLMGHSWGGLVAVASAIAHPEHVRRLMVVDGNAGDASVDPAEVNAEREAAFDWSRRSVRRDSGGESLPA